MSPVAEMHAADRTDLIAGLAVFHFAVLHARMPDWQGVEVTDQRPDFTGGCIEDTVLA